MPLIDNHIHAGDKYGPVEQAIERMDAHGVTHAVIVQHIGQYNNTYVAECVDRFPNRFFGIAMVDLALPDAPRTLRAWIKERKLQGVRLPAMSLSRRPDVWQIAAELHLVISVSGLQPRDLGQITRLKDFVTANPRTRLRIEHFGHPDPCEPAPHITNQRIMELAEGKGVYLQLSAPYMISKQDYPYDDLLPFIEAARKHFGPYRIIWGSCWPVTEQHMDYGKSLAWLDTLGLSDFQKDAVLNGNAVRLWDPRHRKIKADGEAIETAADDVGGES